MLINLLVIWGKTHNLYNLMLLYTRRLHCVQMRQLDAYVCILLNRTPSVRTPWRELFIRTTVKCSGYGGYIHSVYHVLCIVIMQNDANKIIHSTSQLYLCTVHVQLKLLIKGSFWRTVYVCLTSVIILIYYEFTGLPARPYARNPTNRTNCWLRTGLCSGRRALCTRGHEPGL